jgi:hypothetical protein
VLAKHIARGPCEKYPDQEPLTVRLAAPDHPAKRSMGRCRHHNRRLKSLDFHRYIFSGWARLALPAKFAARTDVIFERPPAGSK